MNRELILCIPGPWSDRNGFLRQVITSQPTGRFMFAGGVLADIVAKDHVALEFCGKDPRMAESFKIAGQGKMPASCLEEISRHSAVLYLHFPLEIVAQRDRLLKFTKLVRELGGMAVKLESSGIAHTWEAWEARLTGSLFDLYCAAVVLVGDQDVYYSCGMHHFGLPESAVSRTVDVESAADLMNRFNFWRINDRPTLASGETFSLSADRPAFRLRLEPDSRHPADDLFHNPAGVWRLEQTATVASNKWKKPAGEPLFVAVSQGDEKMHAAFVQAKATLPEFLRAIESDRFARAVSAVKLKIRDEEQSADLGEDRFVFLWVWNVREEEGALVARVIELPEGGINALSVNEDIRFGPDVVYDWMLREGSQAWGAYTMRAARDGMEAKERLQYDEYTGILAYNDI
jgi:uncharacterized protein YegJ (DUF2314 family)